HVCFESSLWYRRRSIAASEIQDLEPFRDAESLDERLSALSHALRNTSKVAFFPKCFVWIHWSTRSAVVGSINCFTSDTRLARSFTSSRTISSLRAMYTQ